MALAAGGCGGKEEKDVLDDLKGRHAGRGGGHGQGAAPGCAGAGGGAAGTTGTGGGQGGSGGDSCPALARFRAIASEPTERFYEGVAPLPGGRLLLLGRQSAQVYEPATETFRATGTFAEPREGGGFSVERLADGRVLVVGGTDHPLSRVALAGAQIYDPTTETFSPAGNMTEGRVRPSLTLLPDGRVLIAGGVAWPTNEDEPPFVRQSVETFDPATGLFTAIAPVPGADAPGRTVLLADGRVLVTTVGPSSYFFDPATGSYEETPLAVSATEVLTRLADGRILLTGRVEGSVTTAEARLFDPASGATTAIAPMVHARQGHATAVLPDGQVLVIGGTTIQSGPVLPAELFDPVTATFTEIAATPLITRFPPATMLLTDGTVLLAGGTTAAPGAEIFVPGAAAPSGYCPTPAAFRPTAGAPVDVGITSVRAAKLGDGRVLVVSPAFGQVFDPRTETFTFAGNLVTPREFVSFQATALGDGRVLVTGGDVGGRITTASAEVFDPATGTFARVGDMTAPRGSHTATLLADGRVLIAGGMAPQPDFSVPPQVHGSAEVFDPATGTFSPAGDMTVTRAGHRAVRLADGRVLVAGGRDPGPGGAEADLFDPATGTFRRTADVPLRNRGAMVLLADGRVLHTGGHPIDTIDLSAEARIYDPASETDAPVSAMRYGRAEHAMTLLGDGRVLVTGGASLLVAELFDPATGTFTATAPMRTFRANHAAVRLGDGRVFIFGHGGQRPPAELFIPAAP